MKLAKLCLRASVSSETGRSKFMCGVPIGMYQGVHIVKTEADVISPFVDGLVCGSPLGLAEGTMRA
jgi:hypothetical protein